MDKNYHIPGVYFTKILTTNIYSKYTELFMTYDRF